MPDPATPTPEPPRQTRSPSGGLAVAMLAAVIAALVVLFLRAPTDASLPGGGGAGGDAGGGAGGNAAAPQVRCGEPGASVRIGEVGEAAPEEPLIAAPFAAEVGRAAVLESGWALGVKRTSDAGTVAEVVLLDGGGQRREVVGLGPVRGDTDAPLVVPTAGQPGWVAGLLEPNAGGYALRLVFRGDDGLVWAAEIDQGRDESLAFDMDFGPAAGVVAWDDIDKEGERGLVKLMRLDPKTRKTVGKPAVVSRANVDAELPRLARRPGGFWLAYLARAPQPDDAGGTGGDGRYAAEAIVPTWIELLPLDEDGRPVGQPAAVTAQDGYALTYDLLAASDGSALLAWREDDTPDGSHGGRVLMLRAGASGASETQVVTEEDVGAGVPRLLSGWLAVPNSRAVARLAPLAAAGRLAGALLEEPTVGGAQPLAARGGDLLLARPQGRAMDLSVVRCDGALHTLSGPPPPDGGAP